MDDASGPPVDSTCLSPAPPAAFVLGDIVSEADRPAVYVVRKSTDGGSRVERRKSLAHLQRLRRHLTSQLGLADVPDLPTRDDEVRRTHVETLLSFLSDRMVDGTLSLGTDGELAHFAHSSLPVPGVWADTTTDSTTSGSTAVQAPKTRKVTVDVTIAGAKDAVVSPISWMAEPNKFFAVATLGHQRFVTDTVVAPHGNDPTWTLQEGTFTAQSAAEWLEVSVMALAGLMGAPVLVGVARVPVYAHLCVGTVTAPPPVREYPLLDVRTARVNGTVALAITASCIASRCHLSLRGCPFAELPLRVETGDVFFFSTRRIMAATTRLVTWSEWDHVGVVIGGKRLRLLESISGQGVILRDLDIAMNLYMGVCSSIAVRRLAADAARTRTAQLTEAALRFAQETRGLPYNYSVLDMVTTSTEERGPASAMFCSQLVVALLRKIGLMGAQCLPDNYLPGTLAVTADLPADPLLRFSGWNWTGANPEHYFVELSRKMDYPFGVLDGRMNASWKTHRAGDTVQVVGTDDFGFLLLSDGTSAPSAFVDRTVL